MTLIAGTRLGPYEVVGALGAGGMGEVYRAKDTKLDRFVAIKVLPSQLADNPTALSRFEREAKAVAALSHPNILSIFDFGRHGDTAYAVMELLEGETLRDKLVAPIPIRKAIDYGIQIARGLAAAHGKGIVHRDLKPENVFVTADGRVKILDFGLARQTLAFAGAGATVSPTIERHTDAGTVLGTVGYMSPEQARGEPGDHRSDIFSLGALLYELVSGRRAFQRDTAAETLTAILREDPPAFTASSSTDVPAGLARVIDHSLEKNPAERFQSASDAAFALENLSGAPTSTVRAAVNASRKHASWLPWSMAALLAVVSIALAQGVLRRPAAAAPVTRLAIPFPREIPYALRGSSQRSLAIAPDGSAVVYASETTPGQRQLYSRVLNRLTIEPIAGTEGAYQPFFSLDGRWLAFFTGAGELKKVSANGGQPITLARGLPNGQRGFGVWRPDNVIVFSVFSPLMQVSGDGGTPTPLFTAQTVGADIHQFPQVVPATGDLLFAAGDDVKGAPPRLELMRWNTRQRFTVLDNASVVELTTSGHLVFIRDQSLMVAAFDAARGVAGPALPLTDAVLTDDTRWPAAQLAVSPSGTMVYVPAGGSALPATLGWIDRDGSFAESGTLPPETRVSASLSPDGNSAAVLLGTHVFVFDLLRRVLRPLDVGNRRPESIGWHRDGRRIVLGGPSFSIFDPDSGRDTPIADGTRLGRFVTWSLDGRTAAFMTFSPTDDIYTVSLETGAKPKPFIATAAVESYPAISPDGRWMAYTSTSPGAANLRTDVYLVRFPEGTGKTQITSAGGGPPFWSADSRELFFSAPPGVLQSVSVSAGEKPQVGPARTLFPLNRRQVVGVAPDGRRFLAIQRPPAEAPREMIVVQNWLQELTRVLPAQR